jgi:hypothetical protein
MNDGARNALCGYLYQIVAGAGLAALAVEVSDDEQGDLLCALIIKAREARILHEMHGQDLLLHRQDAADNSGTAVQFKFSQARGKRDHYTIGAAGDPASVSPMHGRRFA